MAVLCVFDTTSVNETPSSDCSTLYPVTVYPFAGADVHVSCILVSDCGVAVNNPSAPGTSPATTDTAELNTEFPTWLTAVTL